MKLVFLLLVILINFFNPSLLKSQEKIDLANNNIKKNNRKELINKDKTEIKRIHIVKIGDTISSISKLYLINKDLIIKLNNLKNENYIFVGQNLIISQSAENNSKPSDLKNNYHIVQLGESLTDVSSKYNLKLGYLVKINNLKNPDSIKVGQKLFLSKNNGNRSENYPIIKNKKNNKLSDLKKKIYGPIIIQSLSFDNIQGKNFLNVINQENKKLILSINCDSNEINVRIPGRKWKGAQPAREEFEKSLINDFC